MKGRIVALFLALLLVVQVISFGAIHASITHNAEDSLVAELQTGERVLRRLLDQRAGKLHDAAELLAKDYGFRSTVGLSLAEAGTVDTIKDALVNQGERIGASVVAYFDDQQQLVAATRDGAASFGTALRQLIQSDTGAALAVQGDQVYQVVAVQVRTPAPVGWVLMGFALDREVLDDLKALSELQSVVLLQTTAKPWLSIVDNLDGNAAAALRARLGQAAPADGIVELAGERMQARFVPLIGGGQPLGVLLLRSLDAALAPYQQLQLVLFGLTVLGVAVFALVSVLLARGISGPITSLSAAARRLERGDYDTPVPSTSRLDEVHKLAIALESMREGIRRRDALVNNLAYVDQLTLLPNRARFAEFLQHHLINSDTPGAVLMLDLDRFKHVNDVLGHEVGDRLLQSVAERLQALCAPAHSVLARLSGDEFAVLLAHTDAHAASEAALAILKDFERPLQIDNETIDLGAGIGIVLFPEHGADVNLLLGRAELAMYAAKTRQCGSLIYHAQLDAGSQESLSLLTELRHAVEGDELRMFLQPKIDLARGQRRRRRGAGALAAPHAWPGAADAVHPVRRADRLHPPAQRLGAGQRGPVRAAGGGRGPHAAAVGQPVHARPDGPGPAGQDRGHARAAACTDRLAMPGDHRERHHGRPRAGTVDAGAPARHGLQAVHRRLRHRLFLAGLPEAPAGGRAQDRQELCHGHGA